INAWFRKKTDFISIFTFAQIINIQHFFMTSEIITILANLALTLSLIVAVIFGIAQVRTTARDRQERLTLEALRNFQTREFAELIHYITTHKMPSSREELQARPSD